jgi:5'(3')-deoxyribonucleotidase
MAPYIFVDSDGVVADFEAHYFEYFGHKHNSVSDEDMWKSINSYPEFFRNLPLLPGAVENITNLIKCGWHVEILTACPKSNYAHSALMKKLFFREKFGPDLRVLPVLGGKNKVLFMHKPGDILIDDFAKNIKPWQEAGGIGIVHKNWVDTRKELVDYIHNNLDIVV